MKSINQLVYSIVSIFAIVSACAALPINVASIDHASSWMVGLLAITCISITILACTCCHRSKSGFELSDIKDRKEFENENTIVDQTNSGSRSEFPIFRAISPTPNTCHSLNITENSLDNRILSNIVNQNQMNRTFEFENSQNNNGPISTVDMENIQNNNAMDYIPNRNEINITIEPSPHSINRNLLMDSNRDASSNQQQQQHHLHYHNDMAMMEATTSGIHMVEHSMPTTASTSIATFENFASCSSLSSFEPCHDLNAYHQNDGILLNFSGTPPATASESLNNYIDLDDDVDDDEDDNDNEENFDDGENDENVESFPTIRKSTDDGTKLADRTHDKAQSSAVNFALADDTELCHRIDVSNVSHEPIRHHKIDIELDKMDDDTISVEEALRALDFAISGGESLLSDDPDDDSESDNDEHDDDDNKNEDSIDVKLHTPHHYEGINDAAAPIASAATVVHSEHQQQPNVGVDLDAGMPDNTKCKGLIEIADAKDKLIVIVNDVDEMHDAPKCHSDDIAPDAEHTHREYVRELATELVDSVLDECTNRIASLPMNEPQLDESTENESHATVTADSFIAESVVSPMQLAEATNTAMAAVNDFEAGPAPTTAIRSSNGTFNAINLDDSLDETFVIGKLEASTPWHKTADGNVQREPNRMGVNLFPPLDESNECALSVSDIEPLAKTDGQLDVHIAYATFEVPANPNENQLATTFVKNDDATFIAEAAAAAAAATTTVDVFEKTANRSTIQNMHDTFDVAATEAAAAAPTSTVSSDSKPRNDVPRINPSIKIDKEEANSDDLTTQTPMNTPIELNYVGDSWDQFVSKSMNNKSNDSCTTMPKIDNPAAAFDDDDDDDDDNSQRMTNRTTTTALTAASISKNPWFLHGPQSNDTFDVNDTDYSNYDGINDDSESIDDNPELLSLTFDALRKQLAESLPHASVRPSVDYSDDEDNASDSDPDGDNIEYYTRFENPKSEVVINYKQQLSPILEESEDETCKTFVMNETKCLDSTSTGCIETSEAIMGVTKVLMASNDTLFNFEDTLDEREDMLSPRNFNNSMTAANQMNASGTSTAKSITPQPENCRTPTNDGFLAAYPAEYKPNDLNSDNHANNDIRPNSLQLTIENLTNNLGDLLSPEQQKTFSEEINTMEQLSSDLSATIDATNTLDDLKTCISVHLATDDAKLDENSSSAAAIPMEKSAGNQLSNSPIESGRTKIDVVELENDSHQTSTDVDELPVIMVNKTIEKPNNTIENLIRQLPNNDDGDDDDGDGGGGGGCRDINTKSSEHLKQSDTALCDVLEPIDSAKENKSPNLDFQTNVTRAETKSNLNKANELNEIGVKMGNTPAPNDLNHSGQLSGEEDPWADIRFTGPRTTDNMIIQQITGTFTTNDWDSDIEDSNSSEEFLYTKGVSQIGTDYLRSTTQDMKFPLDASRKQHLDVDSDDEHMDKSPTQNESSQETSNDEQLNAQDIWNSHEDLIAVSANADADSADDILDGSSISENENEWVPSSWDSLAKPMRSALKSPDKSSSKTGTKNRRSVVFKKQSYQSVYEYPKENVTASPTQNAERQQGWATYLANSSPFCSGVSDSFLVGHTVDDDDDDDAIRINQPIEFNALNGFAVSSSSRPFHLNQFGIECHTWPNESEFSWSQHQTEKEHANGDINQTIDAGWPTNGDLSPNDDQCELKSPNSMQRPDSGVGESTELYATESLSLGDLCHTKSSLRLPLNVFAAAAAAAEASSLTTTTTGIAATEKDGLQSQTSTDDQNELSKSLSSQNEYSSGENVVASDSMESLNSFDGGKSSIQNHLSSCNSTNADGLLINNATEMKCVPDETSIHNDIKTTTTPGAVTTITATATNPSKKCDYRTTANRQSDSGEDEDSGIENIVRITKEI